MGLTNPAIYFEQGGFSAPGMSEDGYEFAPSGFPGLISSSTVLDPPFGPRSFTGQKPRRLWPFPYSTVTLSRRILLLLNFHLAEWSLSSFSIIKSRMTPRVPMAAIDTTTRSRRRAFRPVDDEKPQAAFYRDHLGGPRPPPRPCPG